MGLTLFVTGAGGPAGVSVIRALGGAGHRVVGADADRGAVGLRLADDACVIPRADDPCFVEAVLACAHDHGAQVLISTVAEELEALAARPSALAAAPVRSWLPKYRTLVLCNDKWQFAQALREYNVPAPITALGLEGAGPPPWVIKPRRGRGSRDVRIVRDVGAAREAMSATPDPIVQALCHGREFTADCLVAPDGALAGCVPRWRLETKAGISTKGETFTSAAVSAAVHAALGAVALEGPANVQGFVDDDGSVQIVEINPRFSGGLALSLAAGADLVGEYIRGAIGEPLRTDHLAFRNGVRMYRYFEEVFEESE